MLVVMCITMRRAWVMKGMEGAVTDRKKDFDDHRH